MHLLILVSIISVWTDLVRGHSHLECSSVINDQCKGFARYYTFNKLGFEKQQASKDQSLLVQGTWTCPARPDPSAQEYTEAYPIAKVNPGQLVTLQWPPRGHAGQPHSPVWIYCSNEGQMKQQTLQVDPNNPAASGVTLLGTLPFSDRCTGDDISWAKCTGQIKIPNSWKPGRVHSCQWVWTLNGGQTYVDCFDYEVIEASPSVNATQPTVHSPSNTTSFKKPLLNSTNTGKSVPQMVAIFLTLKSNATSSGEQEKAWKKKFCGFAKILCTSGNASLREQSICQPTFLDSCEDIMSLPPPPSNTTLVLPNLELDPNASQN